MFYELFKKTKYIWKKGEKTKVYDQTFSTSWKIYTPDATHPSLHNCVARPGACADFKKYAKLCCHINWQRCWEVSGSGRHLYNFRPMVSLKSPKYMFIPFITEKRAISQLRLGVRLIYLNQNQDSKSWFWFTVLFEQIGNRISNWVDHTQFMILSESIIQDGGDGILHSFIWEIRNMILKQVNHTTFKFQNESSTSPWNYGIET